MSPFLSRLGCQILSLTIKHGITLIPIYIPTHLNVKADYLSWVWMLPEWHLLPQVAQTSFHLWILPEVDLLASSFTTQMPVLLYLGISTTSGGLGVDCLQPPLDISGKLCVSSSCIDSSSSVHVSGRTYQRSMQTFDSSGTMLDGGLMASHSSHHVGRHSSVVSHHKRYHCESEHGYFSFCLFKCRLVDFLNNRIKF